MSAFLAPESSLKRLRDYSMYPNQIVSAGGSARLGTRACHLHPCWVLCWYPVYLYEIRGMIHPIITSCPRLNAERDIFCPSESSLSKHDPNGCPRSTQNTRTPRSGCRKNVLRIREERSNQQQRLRLFGRPTLKTSAQSPPPAPRLRLRTDPYPSEVRPDLMLEPSSYR